MLSDKDFRAHLPKDKEYSDEEVIKLKEAMYKWADFIFDVWMEEKIKSKKLNYERK